jgi:hypothetical protein
LEEAESLLEEALLEEAEDEAQEESDLSDR